MINNRSRGRVAVLASVAAAGAALAGPATAAPLWPGGPDIPGAPAIVPGQVQQAPCSNAARGCIRLSDDTAWLMDNGRTVFGPTPISHGRPGFESHPGVFNVAFKDIYHWSTMHNAEMRYAVFFDGDIATHIGPIDEQSHGCIRMTPDGAREFFNYLQPGDVIEVLP